MKNSKFPLLLLALTLLPFVSCTDHVAKVTPTYDIEVGKTITRSISGVILDHQNNPVSGAEVFLNGDNTATDENGFFIFFDKEVYENIAYVTAKKSGFFLGSRSFVPTTGINQIKIKLLERKKVGTINSEIGGQIDFEGVSISMGAGFVDESGNPYEGEVTVYGKYIDPTSKDIGIEMPGSLRGTGPDGETALASYGMVAVELTDERGDEIQIAKGNVTELTVPVPSGLQFISPTSIPLWHFDEEKGYWVEEGEAKKVGNTYVGEVTHFSFWNCDIRVPSVIASGRVTTESGVELPGMRIHIRSAGAGSRMGYTGSGGTFKGIMPIDEPLTFTVSGGHLQQEPYVFKKTLTQDNAEIGTLVIPDPYIPKNVTVSGTIVDCDNSIVSDAVLFVNNQPINVSNGRFEAMILERTKAKVLALGQAGNLAKNFNWSIGSEDETVTIGLCQGSSNGGPAGDWNSDVDSFFISYQLNGTRISILPKASFKVRSTGARFEFHVNSEDPRNDFQIVMSNLKPADTTNFEYSISGRTENRLFDLPAANFPSDGSPILPDLITLDVVELGTTSGSTGVIKFYGSFFFKHASTGQLEERRITNGVIAYKLK